MKINAKETLMKVGKYKDTYRYVMRADNYGRMSEKKVIAEAAVHSGIAKGALNAAWTAIADVISSWATEGHSVPVPGLGTMRFAVNAKSVANVNDVATNLIETRKIIFTPSVDIKEALRSTPITITCLDRKGFVVKQTQSSDGGNLVPDDDDNMTEG